MYCMSGETITKEFKIDISQIMSGTKRKVASQKDESGESLDKRKKLIRYDVYKKLCELLFEGQGDDYAFYHMFLKLDWNLLARSNNCLTMNVNDLQWDNDSLVLYCSKTKGDQQVDKSGDL